MPMIGTRSRMAAHTVLAVALLLLLQCCGRCAVTHRGMPRTMRRAVVEMMARDKLYEDVLAERVTLNEAEVSAEDRERLLPKDKQQGQGVDPLAAMLGLVATGDYQSGRDMRLAAAVLGAGVRCYMYKRVTFNVLALKTAVKLQATDVALRIRMGVLGDLVLRVADMLSALDVPCDELISLMSVAKKHRTPDTYKREELTTGLETSGTALTGAIGKACVATDLAEYTAKLCPADDAAAVKAGAVASAGPTGQTTLAAVEYLLDKGENSLMDEYERMYMLRTADMYVWKQTVNFLDLPAGKNGPAAKSTRTVAPLFLETVIKTMDRTTQTAALVKLVDDRAAAATIAAAFGK